mmetsp:Transcript_16236/g.49127  ORF Transcript_16236/g.49127 Transcript_16236/m.49127 type:complete len:255 (-) Transcript_16236:2-766(-)
MGSAAPKTTRAAPKLCMATQATKNQTAQTSWTRSRPDDPQNLGSSQQGFVVDELGQNGDGALEPGGVGREEEELEPGNVAQQAKVQDRHDQSARTRVTCHQRLVGGDVSEKEFPEQQKTRVDPGHCPRDHGRRADFESPERHHAADSGTKIKCISSVAAVCFCISRLWPFSKSSYLATSARRSCFPKNASLSAKIHRTTTALNATCVRSQRSATVSSPSRPPSRSWKSGITRSARSDIVTTRCSSLARDSALFR